MLEKEMLTQLHKLNYAIVVPMANEEKDFDPFINELKKELNKLGCGKVYFIVDNVSKDNTLKCCTNLSKLDKRFITVYAPENKNVVDAYRRGYKEALANNHCFILEMDAGLSHNPIQIEQFLIKWQQGYTAVFGSRFINGGDIINSNWRRKFLSKYGTVLANLLLATSFKDMTSGYQGFTKELVAKFVAYPLLSKGHFYQTELRYLLRKTNYIEIPIQYEAPSPSVSAKSIQNSLYVLLKLFLLRLIFKAKIIQ